MVQFLTIIFFVAAAALLIAAIVKRRQYNEDPKAPRTFRVLCSLAFLAFLTTACLFIAPGFVAQMVIEPVGGIDSKIYTNSSRDSGSRNNSANIASWNHKFQQTPAPTTGQDQVQVQPNTDQPSESETAPPQTAAVTDTGPSWSHGPLASAIRTQRLIVHTADTAIVVNDIPQAIAHIRQTAASLVLQRRIDE